MANSYLKCGLLSVTCCVLAELGVMSAAEAQGASSSLSREELSSQAVALFNQQKFSEALSLYDEILRRDGNDPKALNARGKLHFEIGSIEAAHRDYSAAIRILESGANSDPKLLAHLYHRRAFVHSGTDKDRRALSDAERALQLDPQYSSAMITAGAALERLGQLDAAVKLFSRALEIDPSSLVARSNLVLIANKTEDFALAASVCKAWRKNAEDKERATYAGALDAKSLEDRVPVNPGAPSFYSNCERAFAAVGDTAAVADLRGHAASAPAMSAADLVVRGNARLRMGESDAGIADFNRALEISPTYVEALLARADAARHAGRHDDAAKDLTTASQLQPDDAEIESQYASALFRSGQPEKAIEVAERVADHDPKSVFAWETVAWAQARRGKHDLALESLDQALTLAKGKDHDRLRGFRVDHLFQLERFDEAMKELNQLIAKGVPGQLMKRVWLYNRLGDIEQAKADARRAIEIGDESQLAEEYLRYANRRSQVGPSSAIAAILSRIGDEMIPTPEPDSSTQNGSSDQADSLRSPKIGSLLYRIPQEFILFVFAFGLGLLLIFTRRFRNLTKSPERRSDDPVLWVAGPLAVISVSASVIFGITLFDPIGEYRFLTHTPNRLLVPGVPVEITLSEMTDFDFLSRREILRQRDNAARQHGTTLIAEYSPSPAVFREIENGRPWWGIRGLYQFGSGPRSIDGVSEESRFVLNPFLLVGLSEGRFYQTQSLVGRAEGAYPKPKAARLTAEGAFLAEYELSGHLAFLEDSGFRAVESKFTLVAYNARDLGFGWLRFDVTKSSGVRFAASDGTEIPLIQFIHRGGSCGYPGGCNNMSPHQPQLEVSVTSFPAKIAGQLIPAVKGPTASNDGKPLRFEILLVATPSPGVQ